MESLSRASPDRLVVVVVVCVRVQVRAWRRTLHMYDPNPEAAMDDGPTQTPRMPKPGACATPASEARTDTSCG